MIRLLTIILTLSFSIATLGQRQRLTHYDDHNGMSQWHVTKILQDKRGFMWFASWNGLNRFDGYEFATFKSKPGDGADLTSDRIRNMIIGDDGNIYCVINDYVWRFNLHTYKFETLDEATQERYHARIIYDTTVTPPQPFTIGEFSFPDVRQVFTDSQKNTWLMRPYGVEKISNYTQPAQMLQGIPTDIVRTIFRDSKKRIWIGCRNTGTLVVLDSLANLIGYLGKDGRIHREQTTFAPVFCMHQQKNGTIWIGSKPEGLFRMRETAPGTFAIEHFTKGTNAEIAKGLTINSQEIYDLKEDRKGRLWIATFVGGLNMIEHPEAQKLTFRNPQNTFKSLDKQNSSIRRLMIVGDSVLLCTTTEGFVVAKGLKGRPQNITFNVHKREANRKESLGSSAVMDMLLDRKGRLFLSTESGGVNMLLTKDLTAKQLDFKHYTTDNGMGSDVAVAMTEVGDEILVQCNNQLTRLNVDTDTKENFNDFFFSFPTRFSDAEPILLKDGRWLLSMETGVMVIPEQAFHQRINTPKIVITCVKMPTKPDNYAVDSNDTITLSPAERDVTISYAALEFTKNTHIKYITRFTEADAFFGGKDTAEWSTPQEVHSSTFYNLAPGTYILEIKSTNAEGLWVDNVRKITIIVEPTFWETPLAYIIYILLTILIISGITYTVVYIRHLERQREENLQAYLKLVSAADTTSPAENTTVGSEESTAGNAESQVQPEATAPSGGKATDGTTTTVVSHLSDEDDAFMRRLMTFIDENLGDSSVGVDEMASATATSRSSLNRKMKSILGVTPADFLKEARMKRACQQLTNTSNGINDIAYACGFSDPKYFSKCFKVSLGMSPSDYRAQNQH